MKKSFIALIVAGVLVVITLIYSLVVYGRGISKKFKVEREYANISIAVQNRWDAQETLFEAVASLVEHSQYQLGLITEARQKLLLNQDLTEISQEIDLEISQTLLLIEDNQTAEVSSAYRAYMANSAALLNRIAFVKEDYNNTVTDYNTYINQPPRNIIFKIFGFENYPLYSAN